MDSKTRRLPSLPFLEESGPSQNAQSTSKASIRSFDSDTSQPSNLQPSPSISRTTEKSTEVATSKRKSSKAMDEEGEPNRLSSITEEASHDIGNSHDLSTGRFKYSKSPIVASARKGFSQPVAQDSKSNIDPCLLDDFYDDLEDALRENVRNVVQELGNTLSSFDEQYNRKTETKFLDYCQRQGRASDLMIEDQVDKIDYSISSFMYRQLHAQRNVILEDAFKHSALPSGFAKPNILADRLSEIREAFKEELDKIKENKLKRLTYIFDGHLVEKSREVFKKIRAKMETGTQNTGAANSEYKFSVQETLSALESNNRNNLSFLLSFETVVEDMKVKVLKL